MSIKQKFYQGSRVYHSTEKITKVEKTADSYKITTERRKGLSFKAQDIHTEPKVGSVITLYFASVSKLVAMELNGHTHYLVDKKHFTSKNDD